MVDVCCLPCPLLIADNHFSHGETSHCLVVQFGDDLRFDQNGAPLAIRLWWKQALPELCHKSPGRIFDFRFSILEEIEGLGMRIK